MRNGGCGLETRCCSLLVLVCSDGNSGALSDEEHDMMSGDEPPDDWYNIGMTLPDLISTARCLNDVCGGFSHDSRVRCGAEPIVMMSCCGRSFNVLFAASVWFLRQVFHSSCEVLGEIILQDFDTALHRQLQAPIGPAPDSECSTRQTDPPASWHGNGILAARSVSIFMFIHFMGRSGKGCSLSRMCHLRRWNCLPGLLTLLQSIPAEEGLSCLQVATLCRLSGTLSQAVQVECPGQESLHQVTRTLLLPVPFFVVGAASLSW